MISASFDGTLHKLKLEKNKIIPIDIYRGHCDQVRNICIRNDDKLFLSSCQDHSLRLWDSNIFDNSLCLFRGNTDFVTGGILMGGNNVIACSWDQTIKIWKYDLE